MPRRRPIGEFELIARYFAPLARGFKGAGGLKSDNAFLPADGANDCVVKTDTVISGVHFLPDEKPERIAAKALRVCLSDLAAGGARPLTYLVALSLPLGWKETWVAGFARGLAADQRRYGINLCGGDTTVTPGPLTVTITAIGRVRRGKGLGRTGARVGNELWVTGSIGDGGLGLLAAQGRLATIETKHRAHLERRFRVPQPRVALGPHLVGIANAAADISDGLLADAGHIAEASRLGLTIERGDVPLSAAAKYAVARDSRLWANVLGGGDDYELAIAVSPRKRAAFVAAAMDEGVKVTCIGRFRRGSGVELTVDGRVSRVAQRGFVHF